MKCSAAQGRLPSRSPIGPVNVRVVRRYVGGLYSECEQVVEQVAVNIQSRHRGLGPSVALSGTQRMPNLTMKQ